MHLHGLQLIIILMSTDGIMSASRNPATGFVDGTHGQYITDPSAPSDYMKQQLKNYEESVGISHDYGRQSGSETNAGPGSEMAPPVLKEAPVESATYKPLEELNPSTKQDGIVKERKLKPSPKDFDNRKLNKAVGAADKPVSGGSFALRLAAGMVAIDFEKTTTETPARFNFDNGTSVAASESGSDGLNGDDHVSVSSRKSSTEKSVPGEEPNSDIAATSDPIDEEIKKVLDYLPKLPIMKLSDNSTDFGFHKDPEEAALDDRITQVARQLAETSLRHRYEEKKLGHYIPIRIRQYEDEYPPDWYGPSRKINSANGKSYINPFNIFLEIRQEPPLRFKAVQLPQHIYNAPVYLPQDGTQSKSSTQMENLSNSDSRAFATETNPIPKPEINKNYSPSSSLDNTNILRLRPHLIISNSKNGPETNRIPIILDMTQEKQFRPTHYNQNDLEGYPYGEIA